MPNQERENTTEFTQQHYSKTTEQNSVCHMGRHYSVDWTTGLDYWTHGNCLWGEKGTPMRRTKTPGVM